MTVTTPLSYTPDVLFKQPIICKLFQMVEIGNYYKYISIDYCNACHDFATLSLGPTRCHIGPLPIH